MRWRGLKNRWPTSALRALIGVAVLPLLAQPAAAFYWYGWPGSGVTEPPPLVPRPPTVQIVTEETPPPGMPDFPDPDVPTSPQEVPEPTTLVAAAVGLAAVALARRRKAVAQRRSP